MHVGGVLLKSEIFSKSEFIPLREATNSEGINAGKGANNFSNFPSLIEAFIIIFISQTL